MNKKQRTVGIEEIVTGHAGLTGDTGRNHDNLCAKEGKKYVLLNCDVFQAQDHLQRYKTMDVDANVYLAALEGLVQVVPRVSSALGRARAVANIGGDTWSKKHIPLLSIQTPHTDAQMDHLLCGGTMLRRSVLSECEAKPTST